MNLFYILSNLTSDLKQLKELRKQFERISLELDNAYNKNAEAVKNKPQLCEELEKNLCGVKKSYGHNGLEYICQINRFYLVRSHSILNMVFKNISYIMVRYLKIIFFRFNFILSL